MPDEKKDILGYSDFFAKKAPKFYLLISSMLALGVISGIVLIVAAYGSASAQNVLEGSYSGIEIVSMPALLTMLTTKAFKRRMMLGHITLSVGFITAIYSGFVIASGLLFFLIRSIPAEYMLILLGNAIMFTYFLFTDKVIFGMDKKASVAALLQPSLNIIFFLLASKVLIVQPMPLDTVLIKFGAGIAIFLLASYLLIFLFERPLKKATNMSSMKLFTIMLNEWLYNITPQEAFNTGSFGTKRDVNVDVVTIGSEKGGIKAVMVLPDIHYGPMKGLGGSITPQVIGSMIRKRFNASPFVMHGAVSAADNPIGSSSIYKMSSEIGNYIGRLRNNDFRDVKGSVTFGRDGKCNAIDLNMNSASIVFLTKAPYVTEDIDFNVGKEFERIIKEEGKNPILIDSHNSRFESASKEELSGIGWRSKYVKNYKTAIRNALLKEKAYEMRCGASSALLAPMLGKAIDIGSGYSSVMVVEAGNRRFCFVYFDANNMLPGFRNSVIMHIREKFKMGAEVFTTDTHSVNALNLPVSNVLGRHTNEAKIIPILDKMIRAAIADIEPVRMNYKRIVMKDFGVWGYNAERTITAVTRDIIKKVKYIFPIVIIAGFIVAAYIIYIA